MSGVGHVYADLDVVGYISTTGCRERASSCKGERAVE